MNSEALPLRAIAKVIRSKNAKPYRITLDILFESYEIFDHVVATGALTPELIAAAYGIQLDEVTSHVVYRPGRAIKFTLRRRVVQGSLGDTDVYGAQQHAPLLDILIPWGPRAPQTGGRTGASP